MSTYAVVRGFVTRIGGRAVDAHSAAIDFTVLVPQECEGDPFESEGEARSGEHDFTLEKVVDNRELVLVSLLRDAMVHRLTIQVGYSYTGAQDPGWGEVHGIEVLGPPFYRGVMSSREDHVAGLSIYEHFAWKDEFAILEDGIIDAVAITLQNWPGTVLVLPLRQSNRETKLEQLHLLQRAWVEHFKVRITYCDISRRFEEGGYAPIITGVGV